MKNRTLMRRLSVIICACLLLAVLSACGSPETNPDSVDPNVSSFADTMDPDFKSINFNDGSVFLTAEDAYRYDKPIEKVDFEGIWQFKNWVCENTPAAYWGVAIPEAGNYNVIVTYSRAANNSVRGAISFKEWDEAESEWINHNTTAMTFEPTEGWLEFETASREFWGLPEGELRLSMAPDNNAHVDTNLFINLLSVKIEKIPDDQGGGKSDDLISASPYMEVIADALYYLDGDDNLTILHFFSDYTVEIYEPEQDITIEGTYSISGDILTITVGDTDIILEIYDGGSILKDGDGNIFTY